MLDFLQIFLFVDAPLDTELESIHGCLNQTAILSCRFNGHPKPTLEWGYFKEIRTNKSTLLFSNFTANSTNSHTNSIPLVSAPQKFIPLETQGNYKVSNAVDNSLWLEVSADNTIIDNLL